MLLRLGLFFTCSWRVSFLSIHPSILVSLLTTMSSLIIIGLTIAASLFCLFLLFRNIYFVMKTFWMELYWNWYVTNAILLTCVTVPGTLAILPSAPEAGDRIITVDAMSWSSVACPKWPNRRIAYCQEVGYEYCLWNKLDLICNSVNIPNRRYLACAALPTTSNRISFVQSQQLLLRDAYFIMRLMSACREVKLLAGWQNMESFAISSRFPPDIYVGLQDCLEKMEQSHLLPAPFATNFTYYSCLV